MPTLHIIGCGKLGRALGRLWHQVGVFTIGGIVNRSLESARYAAEFIGAGEPVGSFDALGSADSILIAVPDDAIASCARALAASAVPLKNTIVFHCSGGLSSEELAPLRACGAHIAGAHPACSFADPVAASAFPGVACAIEGDGPAREFLQKAFQDIGGVPFIIPTENKVLYHAAMVLASNYLVALQEIAIQAIQQAGVDRAQAQHILEPLARMTLQNVYRLGPTGALTGPVSRGDHCLIARHLEALRAWNPPVATAYCALGRIAIEIARAQGAAQAVDLDQIERMFEEGGEG